jgi:hypothetical protein
MKLFLYIRRILARFVDYGIFYFVSILLTLMLPVEFDEAFYFYLGLAVPLCWAPLEAVFLKKFRTTPGKKIFGISLPPLSWKESFKWAFRLSRKPPIIETSIPFWRYLIALAVACGAITTLFKSQEILQVAIHYEGQVAGSNWVQYISDDGRFQVHFPKKPEVASTIVDTSAGGELSLNELKVEKEAAFSVSYIDLPKKWRIFSSPTLLKGAMDVVLEHTPGAQLIEKKLVKHKNYPAMDFRMKEGENEVEGRLVLVGDTLYRIMVVYYPDTPRKLQHETFVGSFELKNDDES